MKLTTIHSTRPFIAEDVVEGRHCFLLHAKVVRVHVLGEFLHDMQLALDFLGCRRRSADHGRSQQGQAEENKLYRHPRRKATGGSNREVEMTGE